MELKELYWAAGFIEGEGCFTSDPRGIGYGNASCIRVVQCQQQPLERLRLIFGGSIKGPYPVKPEWARRKPVLEWYITGPRAAGIAMTLYLLMSPNRRQQITTMLTRWKQRRLKSVFRTHCPQGHVYDFIYTDRNGQETRGCRACRAAQARALYERKRTRSRPYRAQGQTHCAQAHAYIFYITQDGFQRRKCLVCQAAGARLRSQKRKEKNHEEHTSSAA